MADGYTRRRALEAGLAVGVAGVAGCLGGDDGGSGDGDGTGDGGGSDDGNGGGDGGGGDGSDGSGSDGGAGPVAGYTQFQYDAANTGRTDESGPSGSVSRAWEYPAAADVPGGEVRLLAPAAADGTLYLPVGGWDDQATLHAVDAATGERQWMAGPVPLDNVGTPAIAGGTLYCALGRDLRAIDAASGDEQWTARINPDGADPVLADGSILVHGSLSPSGSQGDTLYAYDRDGNERWTHSPTIEGSFTTVQTPAAADGTVYLAAEHLTALSVGDGTEEWTAETDSPVTTAPTVGSDAVYVGTDDGILAAYDRADGTERWSVDTDSFGGLQHSFALDDGVVYVTTSDTVTAYSTSDGSEQWSVEQRTNGPPVLAGNALYVRGPTSGVTALSAADGSERWRHETDGRSLTDNCVVHDGRVYTVIGTGTLVALEGA